jgi:HK97 family phage portal protein
MLGRLLNGGGAEERGLSYQDVFERGLDWHGYGHRHAGVSVTQDSALALSAVFGSWRIISEGVATLPRDVVFRRNGIPTPFRPRPAWLDKPNGTETWVEFMGQIMLSVLADGNAYVMVSWDPSGAVASMVVLDPHRVQVQQHESGHVLYRLSSGKDAQVFPQLGGVAPYEIMHFRWMTRPGELTGISPIEQCAETFGIALGAQRYGAKFYEQDATPGGVITLPPEFDLSEAGQKALKEQWQSLHGGANRAKKVAVLTRGAAYKPLQVAPAEAQFLETRAFQVADVARIFGVPPHLLADSTGSTSWGSGLAEQGTAFVRHTLRPHLERIEAKFTELVQIEQLNLRGVSSGAFLNLDEESLLRGDHESRWATHRANVTSGMVMPDEARRAEGLPPLPDGLGSVPWIPLAQDPGLRSEKEAADGIEE